MSNHLTRLEIVGYRGFDHLVIPDLGDVNLFIGKNNVGKTAVIESLVLLGQPCDVDASLVLNEARGLSKLASDTKETWAPQFNQNVGDAIIRIAGFAHSKKIRELTIRTGQGRNLYSERKERPAGPLSEQQLNAVLQQTAVRFDYRGSDGETASAIATVVANQLVIVDTSMLPKPVILFPYVGKTRLVASATDLYSNMVKAGQEEALLSGLRSIAPDISRLTLLTRAGVPTLHASLGQGALLPIQVLGDGVTRVASALLILLQGDGHWYLGDEIENGIHYSVMSDVWRVFLQTAKARNVQVFATTHSYEALKALNEAEKSLGRDAPTVRVKRLQRIDDEIKVIDYNSAELAVAVEAGIEVR